MWCRVGVAVRAVGSVGGAGRAAVAPTNVFSVRGRRLGPEVRGSVCVSAEMLGGSRNLHLHGPQMQGGALARVTPTLLNAAMGRMAQWALPLTGTRRLSTVHATDPSTTATTATDDGASPATTTPTTVVRPSTAIKQRLFAVVQLNGKQYKITESDFVITARLPIEVGTEINLDKVLLVGSASWTAIGTPLVGGGAQVTAIVYDHHRGHKLQVFKKRRRKGYTRKLGHRTNYSTLRITSIKCQAPSPPST